MTHSKFFLKNDLIVGFSFKGHAGAGKYGEDIVCSAISSVCYLVANVITDEYGLDADIVEKDGFFSLRIKSADAMKCREILNGLLSHIKQINEQYTKYTNVTISEV